MGSDDLGEKYGSRLSKVLHIFYHTYSYRGLTVEPD